MNKKEILEKLKKKELLEKKKEEQEEFECNCIRHNICPDCGGDTKTRFWGWDYCTLCKTGFKIHRYHFSRWVERKKN